MNPQLMNQRIQPPSAPNRTSPYGNMQSTPPHATSANPQFAAGQGQNANPPLQQPGSNPQAGGAVTTPQTPVFPSSQQGQTGQGNAQMATPLSPGSESRERERVTLLLEINRELLMAVIELQNAQQAEKKEEAASAAANSTPTEEKDKAEKERAEKAKAASGREYVEYVSVRPCTRKPCTDLFHDLDVCVDFSPTLHILQLLPTVHTSLRAKFLPIPPSCQLLPWHCI